MIYLPLIATFLAAVMLGIGLSSWWVGVGVIILVIAIRS